MSETKQPGLAINDGRLVDSVEDYQFEPIKGYPMLQWQGKRPFRSTHYYPAQLKEVHGPEAEGWRNKIYWGDNLQVMGHLLKQYRGRVKLAYIDPPYDSNAEYKKKIDLHGQSIKNDLSTFEEKQYSDIWNNDEYLQFMYERLVLIRELLAEDGSIYLHCDWRRSHLLRCILDELFGTSSLRNEIIWNRKGGSSNPSTQYDVATDTIFFYGKTSSATFKPTFSKDDPDTQQYIEERFNNYDDSGRRYMKSPIVSPNYRENLVYDYKGYRPPKNGWSISLEVMKKWDEEGKLYFPENGQRIYRKIFLDEYPGQPISNLWTDIYVINPMAKERLGYPTQKPEMLLERIIHASSNPGDLIFDCFMGSGTTQAVAMKLGRRFIGADINLGAVQITTKRLLQVGVDLEVKKTEAQKPKQATIAYNKGLDPTIEHGEDAATAPTTAALPTFNTGFEVYNVNHYDLFRNPVQAKELLLQALEVQPLTAGSVFDGTKDGRMVKIMPVNRIATRADLNDLLANIDLKAFDRLYRENPSRVVERITLVCMGHEADLAASLKQELHPYNVDVEVVDVLRDRQDLQFKRDSEAKVTVKGGWLSVDAFYPMNLLQKLSMQKENVADWRELVESIMIDWNYDGAVLTPALADIPDKNDLVDGRYQVPESAGTIRVKLTDLLSESWEGNVSHG